MTVVVQRQAFEVGAQYDGLLRVVSGAAVVSFTGYVRDLCEHGEVTALELEHYPGMTEKILGEIGDRAALRFGLRGWRIIHRFGVLEEGEAIVWAGAAADHRTEAFSGCQYMMDNLKTRAPFWKREHLRDGRAIWVEAKDLDAQRERDWQDSNL